MTIDLQSIFGDSAARAGGAPAPDLAAASAESSGPTGAQPAPPRTPSPGPAAADLVAPANRAAPADRTADALEPIGLPDHGAQPDALDFGPDGWPVGSIDPEPCPTCPGLLTWQDAGGRWRCDRCDGDALARSMRWADGAARARRPAKPTPEDARRCELAAPADSQHLDSRRPWKRPPGGFPAA